MKFIHLILLSLLFSCSSKMASEYADDGQSEEVVQSDFELVDDSVEVSFDETEEFTDRGDSIMDTPSIETEVTDREIAQSKNVVIEESEYNRAPIVGKFSEVVVAKGDTLMLIAYRLYGDVRRWRELKMWNQDRIKDQFNLKVGSRLMVKIEEDANGVITSSGNPYLILDGDNLGKISEKVYEGTDKYWKAIWNNNKKLIEDPNIIYAGFTLYYLDLDVVKQDRDIASKN